MNGEKGPMVCLRFGRPTERTAGAAKVGSGLTDATRGGRSRRIVCVFAAYASAQTSAVAIFAAIYAGGVIKTSIP